MFDFLPADSAVVELYRTFLPQKVFDAHMHLHDSVTHKDGGIFRRAQGTVADYRTDMAPYLPGAELYVHALPMPEPALKNLSNGRREQICRYVSQEAAKNPGCIASLFAHGKDDYKTLEALANAPAVGSIKCYYYTSSCSTPEECTIGEYLPEAAWELSIARKIPIVLHMMHPQALNDERNFSYICRMTKQYPDARLILAHCGRAFAAWTGIQKIAELATVENVWFDLAAICEVEPIIACLRAAPDRTMWGSDYPICTHRGRSISLGTGFTWLTGDKLPKDTPAATICAENIFAVYRSALLLDLDATDIQRIFYENAKNLFSF